MTVEVNFTSPENWKTNTGASVDAREMVETRLGEDRGYRRFDMGEKVLIVADKILVVSPNPDHIDLFGPSISFRDGAEVFFSDPTSRFVGPSGAWADMHVVIREGLSARLELDRKIVAEIKHVSADKQK